MPRKSFGRSLGNLVQYNKPATKKSRYLLEDVDFIDTENGFKLFKTQPMTNRSQLVCHMVIGPAPPDPIGDDVLCTVNHWIGCTKDDYAKNLAWGGIYIKR
jgi:hypothetical protein